MAVLDSAHVDTFTREHLPDHELWPDLIFTLPELDYPQRLNCGDELLDATIARLGGERPCLRTDTETWSYEALRRRVNQVAHVLVDDLGVVPGNRVLLRGPNTPWGVACWLAVMKVGAVAVATMPLLREAELRPIIDKALPAAALCDARFRADLGALTPAFAVVPYGSEDAEDLCRLSDARSPDFESVATAAT